MPNSVELINGNSKDQKHSAKTGNEVVAEFYKKLRKFCSAQQIEKVINISLVNTYVYVHNPKVASSTINKTLVSYELNQSSIRDKVVIAHQRRQSPLLWPAQLPGEMFYHIMHSADYFKFAFVRNPYTRLLSGYLDKFIREENVTPGRRSVTKTLGRKEDAEVSFEEFIDAIASQKPRSMNQHWRLQTECLFFPIMQFDYIGKFETFERNFDYIKGKLFKNGTKKDKKTLLDVHHKTNSNNKLKEFYSKDMIEKVYKKYEEDFINFAYVKDLPA